MNPQGELQRLQDEIEGEVKKYNAIEKTGKQYAAARNGLFEQQSENSLVLKEIELLQEDAKVFKQVGGVLIDQSKKEAKDTLSARVGHIKVQIENTNDLIKKNEAEQKAMAEKIQKAKQAYYKMVQMLQQPQQ